MDWNRLNLQSVTEQNTLDEFLSTAEIAGTEFQAGTKRPCLKKFRVLAFDTE